MNEKDIGDEELCSMLDEYLVRKDKWKRAVDQPNRYLLQKSYRDIEATIYYAIPDEFKHRGFVIKKGHDQHGHIYLQVFTEQSFRRAQRYLRSLAG